MLLETPGATYEYDGNGLLIVTLADDVELTLDAVKAQREAGFALTQGTPHVVLAITGLRTSATEEARKYASSQVPEGRVAEAILISSLPVRIMGNFYLRFHKPGLPTKMFENRENALVWLREKLETALKKKSQAKTPDSKS